MKKAAQATPNKYLLSERLKYHWSQKEVAAMLGTTRINISRWECGMTTPSPYFRQRLIQLFDKTKEELGLAPSNPLATQDLSFEDEEIDPLTTLPPPEEACLHVWSEPLKSDLIEVNFSSMSHRAIASK
jgi:transcriptional regulator with XRE-family HTH domain